MTEHRSITDLLGHPILADLLDLVRGVLDLVHVRPRREVMGHLPGVEPLAGRDVRILKWYGCRNVRNISV